MGCRCQGGCWYARVGLYACQRLLCQLTLQCETALRQRPANHPRDHIPVAKDTAMICMHVANVWGLLVATALAQGDNMHACACGHNHACMGNSWQSGVMVRCRSAKQLVWGMSV